ncbi:HD-GYP domain-containing protein [Desulfosporosinus sp. SB140]|uniref:HD-GYP domain-containing protein n=1 Tax=Desulfosporosinus paludis TaxID=3115649 RepID=UPI00388F8D51
MKWFLEQVQLNTTLTMTASADLFDRFGVLLLSKGQPMTAAIRELLEKREVFIWNHQKDTSRMSKERKTFPKDVYTKLVGSLWSIYHDARLIQPEHLEKTVLLVETILKELKSQTIHFEFTEFDLGKFKHYDHGTFVHSINVALLTAVTGMNLGYKDRKLKDLTLGALLHDLGKLRIPKEILNKPDNLTNEEYNIIKQHPQLGVEMLNNIRLLPSVIASVKEHHERWNIKGYPHGLAGNNIHLAAQIVAVTDVYEALTADRPYRQGMPPYQALEMILAWSGRDFNPRVVQAFRESLILYPENSMVTLNTGEIGVVVAVTRQFPTRPLIRLLFDSDGRFYNEEVYLDLLQNLTRFIERVEFKEEAC